MWLVRWLRLDVILLILWTWISQCNNNSIDPYSGDYRFEYWPGHRLSWVSSYLLRPGKCQNLYNPISVSSTKCFSNLSLVNDSKIQPYLVYILRASLNKQWFIIIISEVRLSPLGTLASIGLLYQLRMIDDGDYGAIGGMKIGRGNRSTWRKPAPLTLCSSQIPHDQTRARTRAAAVRIQRLTAWAMARP
jgi:hypothetical protein